MELREQLDVEDIGLLTSEVGKNRCIPEQVKVRLKSLHDKMRRLVEEVARRIEAQKYQSAEEAISGLSTSKHEKNRSLALVEADKKVNISCQTLKIAVELFGELNKHILHELENASHVGGGEERNLLFGNALLVYELADFVIHFIEDFQPMGREEIGAIHAQMQNEIAAFKEDLRCLRKQAESPEIEEDVRATTLRAINDRDKAVEIVEREWSSYLESLDSRESTTDALKGKLRTLYLIRDNAKSQISALAIIAVLQFVKHNTEAIEATVQQLAKMKLAPLTPDRVRRLIHLQ
jgi:hypothetical protein